MFIQGFCLVMCWIILTYIWVLNQPTILIINSHAFRMYYPFSILLYRHFGWWFFPLALLNKSFHCVLAFFFLMKIHSKSWHLASLLSESFGVTIEPTKLWDEYRRRSEQECYIFPFTILIQDLLFFSCINTSQWASQVTRW